MFHKWFLFGNNPMRVSHFIGEKQKAYKDGFLASSYSLSLSSHPQHPPPSIYWEYIYKLFIYIYVENIHIQKGENCAGVELDRSKKNLSFLVTITNFVDIFNNGLNNLSLKSRHKERFSMRVLYIFHVWLF